MAHQCRKKGTCHIQTNISSCRFKWAESKQVKYRKKNRDVDDDGWNQFEFQPLRTTNANNFDKFQRRTNEPRKIKIKKNKIHEMYVEHLFIYVCFLNIFNSISLVCCIFFLDINWISLQVFLPSQLLTVASSNRDTRTHTVRCCCYRIIISLAMRTSTLSFGNSRIHTVGGHTKYVLSACVCVVWVYVHV